MKTSVGVLLLGISLKFFIIALFCTFHIEITPVNLKTLIPDFFDIFAQTNPIDMISKFYSAVAVQLDKADDILRSIFTPEPYQISALKGRKKKGNDNKMKSDDLIEVYISFYDGSYQIKIFFRKFPIDKLITAVAKERGEARSNLKFIYKGSELLPHETASMVGIKDKDFIHCVLNGISNNGDIYPVYVRIFHPDGSNAYRRIESKTPMDKVFKAVAEVLGKSVSDLEFTFNGRELKPSDTATMLKMTDRDEIYCVLNGNHNKPSTDLITLKFDLFGDTIQKVTVAQNILIRKLLSMLLATFDDTITLFDVVSTGAVDCLVHGRKLELSQTASILGIVDGDTINCLINEDVSHAIGSIANEIIIKMHYPQIFEELNEELATFAIILDMPMKFCFETVAKYLYGDSLGIDLDIDDLRFEYLGIVVESHQTARMLNMVDGDTMICTRKNGNKNEKLWI